MPPAEDRSIVAIATLAYCLNKALAIGRLVLQARELKLASVIKQSRNSVGPSRKKSQK